MAIGGWVRAHRRSIQGIWFTAGFLGLILILAIVGLTMTAKRWIRAEQKDNMVRDACCCARDGEPDNVKN